MHIYEISRRLVKDGFDVEVICGREAGSAKYEVMDGVKVHRVASFSLAKLRYDIGRIDVGTLLRRLKTMQISYTLMPMAISLLTHPSFLISRL